MDITRIYLVENCYGNSNKIYIGKERHNSKNRRYYQHKKIYGKDIIFTYIDEINSLNKKEWIILECFWIEYFRQFGFELQNKNKGGQGMDFCTDETKLKISKIHIGRICSKETKDKMSKSRQGKAQSEETRNKISNSSKGKIKSDEYKLKLSKARKGVSTKKSKPIIQYDLEGKFIREWDKIDHALKFLGKPINDSSLTQCCKGINKTAHGYKWKYK